MKKQILSFLLASSLIIGVAPINSLAAFVENEISEVEEMEDVYESLFEINTRGSKVPTGSSFVNLANNNYNYDVQSMTVRLYTDTLFSGSTTLKVSSGGISVNKNGMNNASGAVTVTLRKVGDSTISPNGTIPISGGTVSFINLDTNAKYYIEFTKANDTQIYSFSGTIKSG